MQIGRRQASSADCPVSFLDFVDPHPGRCLVAGQSLQEYLRTRLIDEASHPTLDEVLDRAGGRAGGSVSFADAVAALQDDRARR